MQVSRWCTGTTDPHHQRNHRHHLRHQRLQQQQRLHYFHFYYCYYVAVGSTPAGVFKGSDGMTRFEKSLLTTLAVRLEQSARCVCVSVCPDNNLWTKWRLTQIFGLLVYLDATWVEFDGQGHRSKFKVAGGTRVLGNWQDGRILPKCGPKSKTVNNYRPSENFAAEYTAFG